MAKAPSKTAKAVTKTTLQSAKKPARKTSTSRPTSTSAKRPTPKPVKTPAKAPIKANAAAAKKKAISKKKTTQAAAPKTSARKAVKKTSVNVIAKGTLQEQLKTIETRLKRANTVTRSQVKQIDADFNALSAQLGRTKASQTKLARRVTLLSKTLTQDLSDMQSDIRSDLTRALANPTLEAVQNALSAAESRLGESEAAQTEAFARINHHISELATIVESRLSEERQARERAMADMRAAHAETTAKQAAFAKSQQTQGQAMQLRLAEMQSESADAIHMIGDKVVSVAEEMGRRRDIMGAELRQELQDTIQTKDMAFNQFRRDVERRLEALESDARAVEGRIERAVSPITSRIEGLEYGITTAAPVIMAAASETAPLPPAPPHGLPMGAAEDSNSPEVLDSGNPYVQAKVAQMSPEHGAAQQDYANPQPAHSKTAFDAFSPAAEPSSAPVAPPALTGQAEAAETKPTFAVPYNPADYAQAPAAPLPAAQTYPPQPYAAQSPIAENYAAAYNQAAEQGVDPYASQLHSQIPPAVQPQAQYLAPGDPPAPQQYAPYQAPFAAQADQPALSDAELPYANPAYAEASHSGEAAYSAPAAEQSMESARPGSLETVKKLGWRARKKKAAKEHTAPANDAPSKVSGLLTPRNMKIGGAVAALGLVSVIGAQTLIPKTAPNNGAPFAVAENGTIPPVNITENTEVLAPNRAASTQGAQGFEGTNGEIPTQPISHEATIGKYQDNRLSAIAGDPNANAELAAAAASGHPVAQLQLGLSKIEAGDLESGVKLVRASANQDQPAALYRLAKLYETGQGVGQDAETARELTERSARGGNRIAMHDLALYFAEGRGGVEVDMQSAAKWFEKAAERGVVDSQFNLGVLFESGQGLPVDEEAALVWYSIAGAQGDQMAASRVNVLRKSLGEERLARADKRIAGFNPARIDEPANGIFTNLPWMKDKSIRQAQNGGPDEAVRQTQLLLGDLGYEVGAPDGAIGPKTRNAIKSFERVNGLPETGQVNAELIERLETAAGA